MNQALLVDTHAFIEIRSGSPALSQRAKRAFLDADRKLFLSIASVWEMQIKLMIKKLELDLPLKEFVEVALASGLIQLLPIELHHVYVLGSLPYHHRDPFDRLLASQALSEKMPILSGDKAFDPYGLQRIW